VQQHALLYAPSATTFARSSSTAGRPRDVLAAACPDGGPSVPRLAEAEGEATAIAGLYERSRQLKGGEATPQRFLADSARADVIHFAGHAREDALVFGPDAATQTLHAREISAVTFRLHPLVVLAACSTARGRACRTEGIDSLAVAFLHSGARGVVATLWDAEDETASRFARSLHLQIRDGSDVAEALRRVQLEMIASPSPQERNPASWAGVILVGRG
jgi:CHAT domain-containing protein